MIEARLKILEPICSCSCSSVHNLYLLASKNTWRIACSQCQCSEKVSRERIDCQFIIVEPREPEPCPVSRAKEYVLTEYDKKFLKNQHIDPED